MIEINLLPRKKKAINRFVQLLLLGTVAGIVVVAGILGVFSYQTMRVRTLNKEIADIDTELAKLKKTLSLIDRYEAQLATLNTQLGIIDKLNTNRTYWARLVDDIADRVPSTMWLKSIIEKVENTGERKLIINGLTYTNFAVADFMVNIEKSPFFQRIDLVHATRGVLYGRKIVSFELQAIMKV